MPVRYAVRNERQVISGLAFSSILRISFGSKTSFGSEWLNAVSALFFCRLVAEFSCAHERALGVHQRGASCKLTPNRQQKIAARCRQHGVDAFGAQVYAAAFVAQLFEQHDVDQI